MILSDERIEQLQSFHYDSVTPYHCACGELLPCAVNRALDELTQLRISLAEARRREQALFDALRDSIEKHLTNQLDMSYPIIMGFLGFPEPTTDDDPEKMKPASWATFKAIRALADSAEKEGE